MVPRFRIVYVETPCLDELIERYRAAHARSVELWFEHRRVRNAMTRTGCEQVVMRCHFLQTRQSLWSKQSSF